jgi:two-component system OmpR family sensor kinase
MTVSDNGPGIDQALLPSLFERFVRGDASRYRAPGSTSTGLGLAIVSAVVEAQHGTVTARSSPGETVFKVTLPLLPASAVAQDDTDLDPADLDPEDFADFGDFGEAPVSDATAPDPK